MANKQYLIELAIKDNKLKSSLKKSLESPEIQKTLGILGEGITEYLEKDIQRATSILGKVDWSSLLGEKDFERLQQLVAKTVSANKDMIKAFIKTDDLKGIQDAVELVSALGSELKAINPDMTVSGLARSMASLIKVVEPLSAKLNEMSGGTQSFQNILNNFDTSTINKQIKEISESAQSMITALNKKASLDALEKGIKDVYGESIKLQNVMLDSGAMDAYLSKFKTAKAITEEMSKLMKDAERGVYSTPIDRVIFKQQLEGLQGKLSPMLPTLDGSAITKEVETVSKDVDATLKKIEDNLEKSFNRIIEEKLGSIRVKIDVPTEDKLIADINDVIAKVNAKGTNSLQLVGVESAINEAQRKILANTQEWHNRMRDALKFNKKEDIEIDLGVKLREIGADVGEDLRRSIEEYFDDPTNKVSIPVELIISDKNKAILEGGGVTVVGGGGGGEITAESLAKVLNTPIEVKVQEEQQQKKKSDDKLINIDRQGAFAQEIVDVFEKLIVAAGREGNNAKEIAKFFNVRDVNLDKLSKLSSGERNNAIIDAFETLLERGDASLLDQVRNLSKGSTKNVATTAFKQLVQESVFRFDLKQISTQEDVKRSAARDLVVEDYIPKNLNYTALSQIRNTKNPNYKLPTVEELDKLMEELPQTWGKLGQDFLPALEALKQLRNTITDPTNAQEIQKFKEASDKFTKETNEKFFEMKGEMKNYRIGVFNKNHNKYQKNADRTYQGGAHSGSKILDMLDSIDYFEIYDDPSAHTSSTNRKDATDNATRLERFDLKRSAAKAFYRSKEPERTSVLAEDVEVKTFEPKERVDAEAREIDEYKEAAQRRLESINEAQKVEDKTNSAINQLVDQRREEDKKKRTNLKRQFTKNESKISQLGPEATEEILALKKRNEEIGREIADLDIKIGDTKTKTSKITGAAKQLKNAKTETEIQEMQNQVDVLDKDIEVAKQKAEELDKFVEKNFKAEKSVNVEYTKSEKKNRENKSNQSARYTTLSQMLDEKDRVAIPSLQGLTEKDKNIARKLLNNRKINQIINGEEGLGLPQNSLLEGIAKDRIRAYQMGLNQIDEFLLKHQNQTLKYVEDDSDLTEFMKDADTRYVMAGTFKGSQEDESIIKTRINEFKTRMIDSGKGYVADYIDMWSDKNLRELMNKDSVKTRTTTDVTGDTILQEFYRRIVEGGISKRGEAYQYLKDESSKYQNNIEKDENSLAKQMASANEQVKITSDKDVVATERVKEKYKEYISQWLQTIQNNLTEVASSEISNEEKALKLKKNDELRDLISSMANKYFKDFGEALLTEDQSALLKNSGITYKDFNKQEETSLVATKETRQAEVDTVIAQKSELLKQRRLDLLRQISGRISKGEDTANLEKTLSEVESELIKYSDELPHIIQSQFEADLLAVKNATEEEWKQYSTNVANRQKEYDTAKYAELKDKQKTLLGDIATKHKAGESTDNLEKQLKTLNTELVKYEVSTSRMEDIKKSIFPDDASSQAIHVYNSEMAELIKMLQQKALLEAKGESTVEVDRDITKQKSRVREQVRSQIDRDKQVAAQYDPKNQASEFLNETDVDLYVLEQQEVEARRKLNFAQSRLATIQGDKYYNSSIYTDRIESLKDQDVADFIGSGQYKIARDNTIKKADEEFSEYLAEYFDEDVAQRISYEFSHNEDRADMGSMITPKLKEIFATREQLFKEISETDDEATKQILNDKLKNLFEEYKKEIKNSGAGVTRRLAGNAFADALKKARQQYTGGEEYQRMETKAKAIREQQIESEFAADKQANDAKIQEIWKTTKANIKKIKKSTLENSEELREAVEAQAQADGMGNSTEYKRSIVGRVKESLIQQELEAGREEQRASNKQYYDKVRARRTELNRDTYKKLNEQADIVAEDIVMSKLRIMLGQKAELVEGLAGKRKGFVDKNVNGIIENYRNGLSITETGVYKGVNVREQLEKELAHEVAYYAQKYEESSGKLGALRHQRDRATSFGELGTTEIDNLEIARVRAEAEARLSAEKERQINLTEKLTNLTAQNADRTLVQSVAAELQSTEKEIERLKLLTESASSALAIRQEAKDEAEAENKFTPEKLRLWYIDAIEKEKQKLEGGTDEQKTKAEDNIARWEQKLANVEKIIEASKPEAEKPRTVLDMITHAIRDGLAGVTAGGTVNLDASLYNIATETTLQEILRLLGGNGAVEYANQLKKELEKDRPKYERKSSEGKDDSHTTSGKKNKSNKQLDKLNVDGQRIFGELEAQAQAFTSGLKEGKKKYAENFNFIKAITDQAKVVKGLEEQKKKGTLEYIQEQTKLTALYQDYYTKTFGKGKKKPDQPGQSEWAEQGDLGKIKDLKDLLLFKYQRADALVGVGYGVGGSDNTQVSKSNKQTKNTKHTTETQTEVNNSNENVDEGKVAEEITKAMSNIAANGIDLSEKDAAELAEMVKLAVSEALKNDGLGRDTSVKTEVKEGVIEGSKTSTSDKNLPYDVSPDSLIGKLQNTVGGDTGALAKQATLALVLSELQAISKKIPTIGKAGTKSSAQNLLEEFQKMAMGSAMDSKERVSNFDLVNGVMSPALSGAAHSISQKLLDTLSQQYGVGQGYRSQVHTHADSDQTWFSAKDLDHFKNNLGDFGADSIKQQVLLTKDSITVFDMTMVETAEKAGLAIDILKKAGSNVDNEVLEKLTDLGARYQSKDLGSIGAKGLMNLLGVKNYKNDGKQQNSALTEEEIIQRQGDYEAFAKRMADASHSQYVFKSFDGDAFKYQLIDMEGHISKVILAWDELQNKVRVVSDTSTSSIDPMIKKIQQYKLEIQNAQNELLLSNGDDAKFIVAEQEVNKLVDKLQSAKPGELGDEERSKLLDEIESARQKLADEGAKIHKLITQNEKRRGGTAEVKQTITQGTRVRSLVGDAIETKEQDGLQLFSVGDDAPKYLREYVAEYNNLIKAQQQYIKDGSINSVRTQDALKVQTAGVKRLGIEVMNTYKNTQRLQELSAQSESQTYKTPRGAERVLGGSKDIAQSEVNRSTMLQYAKEVLGADLASVKLNTTTGKLTGVLRKNNYVVADMAIEYDKATGKMHLYQEKERESLSGIPGFMHGLKAKSKAIIQYVASMTSIYRILGEIRKGIQYIREIDTALTELKKVTNETEETYDKFLKTAAKTGSRLGSTISAVTEATATFAKLGYTIEQASEMAEAAIVYKNVGDNIASTEDAADSIISTLKGFGLEASESMAIVDKFNEVGNRFAITSQGIGEALRLSASALNEGKNSLDESIAMITAANEVVNDPSSVGTALKTLTLRLRGSKTELEEMGEDVTDMAKTTSQLQAKLLALTGGKVDIMLDANTFKNTTQILREMAAAWEDMTDIQRAEWCPYVQKCA